jgi:tetratricopeptide (TPR) repeat protein
LNLNIYTPPGHIYVAHKNQTDELNIETTARGIHMPTKKYLSIQTKYVQQRTLKEVAGLHHSNAAATFWQTKNYKRAIEEYQKTLAFIPGDPLTEMFLAFNYLFIGDKKKGEALLKRIKDVKLEGSIASNTLVEDYLGGQCDERGIAVIYDQVDSSRESILKKQKEIQVYLEKFPKFREGIFHLAITWLQLGRKKEALDVLNTYHDLYPLNPVVEYYLTHLNLVRLKPALAKRHFKGLKFLLEKADHHPECMKEMTMLLKTVSLL